MADQGRTPSDTCTPLTFRSATVSECDAWGPDVATPVGSATGRVPGLGLVESAGASKRVALLGHSMVYRSALSATHTLSCGVLQVCSGPDTLNARVMSRPTVMGNHEEISDGFNAPSGSSMRARCRAIAL